ncbi:hypothetical protein BC835DRAFT_1306912 [Cytidiella melzeri]|nr:hypothetical protein BC835DRAFT_1306912 [Cytidiella melzeri]
MAKKKSTPNLTLLSVFLSTFTVLADTGSKDDRSNATSRRLRGLHGDGVSNKVGDTMYHKIQGWREQRDISEIRKASQRRRDCRRIQHLHSHSTYLGSRAASLSGPSPYDIPPTPGLIRDGDEGHTDSLPTSPLDLTFGNVHAQSTCCCF